MPYEENSGFIFLVKGKMFGPSRRTLPEREDGRDGLSWNLMDGFSSGGLGPQWPIIPLQRLAELATSLLFAQMQLGGFFLGSRHPAIPRNFLLDFALRNGLRCLGQFFLHFTNAGTKELFQAKVFPPSLSWEPSAPRPRPV